ncbi:MAG TPA: hypothetical protein VGL63_17140 [Streptosporangiaceae bacterium]
MEKPADEQWADMAWAPWHQFSEVVVASVIPATPGIYRFRTHDEPTLLYIGIGGNRRRRLRTLRRWSRKGSNAFVQRPGEKRPFRGHFAAPALARCEEAGCVVEVSWSLATFPDRQERERVESELIARHLREAGADPPWQHGGRGIEQYLAACRSKGDVDT